MSSSNTRSTRSGKEPSASAPQTTTQRKPPTRSGDKTAAPGRRITATLDPADQLLFDMKESGHGNIEIARQLLGVHGLTYEAKTVGTRYRRIKQAKQTKAATENQGHQWTVQEDEALKRAQDFATEKIREGIRRAESQRWQHVQNYMEEKHSNNNTFLQPACRERWAELVSGGSAIPIPPPVQYPFTATSTMPAIPYFPFQPLAADYQQVYYPNEPVDAVPTFFDGEGELIDPAPEAPSFVEVIGTDLAGASRHTPPAQPSYLSSVGDNSHLGGSPPKPQHTAYPDPLMVLAASPQAYYPLVDSQPTIAYGFPQAAEGATSEGLPSPPSPVAANQAAEVSVESIDPELLDAEGSDVEVVGGAVGAVEGGVRGKSLVQPKAAVQGAARSLRSNSQPAPAQGLADPRQKLTVPELRLLCVGRGLVAGGLKNHLLARLAEDEEGKTDEEIRSLLSAKQLSTAGSRSDLLTRARQLDATLSKWGVKNPTQMVPTPASKRVREEDEEENGEEEKEAAKRSRLNPNLKRSHDLVDGAGSGEASPSKRPRLTPATPAAVAEAALPPSAASAPPQTPAQGRVGSSPGMAYYGSQLDLSWEIRRIEEANRDQTAMSIDFWAQPFNPFNTSTPGGDE